MKVSSTFRAGPSSKGLCSKRRRYFHIFQVEAYLTYCEDMSILQHSIQKCIYRLNTELVTKLPTAVWILIGKRNQRSHAYASEKNRIACLKFAREHVGWSIEQWKPEMWSDESSFGCKNQSQQHMTNKIRNRRTSCHARNREA